MYFFPMEFQDSTERKFSIIGKKYTAMIINILVIQ